MASKGSCDPIDPTVDPPLALCTFNRTDYEIPEETLPQPFGPTKQDMQSDTDKLPLSSSQGDEIQIRSSFPCHHLRHLSCYCIWSFPTPGHIFYRLHALCAYIRCLFVAPCMLVMWPSFDVILADLVSVVIPLLELKKATKVFAPISYELLSGSIW
ncbi:hypothetical protein TB2_035115 [Malus domestica]